MFIRESERRLEFRQAMGYRRPPWSILAEFDVSQNGTSRYLELSAHNRCWEHRVEPREDNLSPLYFCRG